MGADTADKEDGETVRYEYDGCDQLSDIVYADGTRVSYAYDKNDNLTVVTDRNGKTTTYVYDEINRVTEIHRSNGISTYNTYNARDQIVSLKSTCDEYDWVVSQYDYTYDKVGNRLSYVKRTQTTRHPNKTDVAESAFYSNNDSDQLVSAKLFDGKKNATVTYTYDDNGNGNGNSGNNGNGNGSKKENSKSEGTEDAGYGNATNAEDSSKQIRNL